MKMDLFKINSMSTQLRSLQSLYKANQKASLHQQRLSTGKRVNSAQDDLASFSIANNIKTSKKGAETALQNISNAKSILSIVEAGQQKQVELLQDIKAKIIQLKDPSLNNNQRQSISESINSLKAEIANVGTQLKFNGRSLVGEGSSVNSIKSALTNEVIQVGSDIDGLYINHYGQGSKIGYEVGLSDDGNSLVIGGGATLYPPTALYKWDGSSWNQLGSNLTGGYTFGESLDISGDGNRIITGASQQGVNNSSQVNGRLEAYEVNNNNLSQLGSDINGDNYDQLGKGVAINKDGSRIIAGGYGNYAKVYEYDNGSWSQLGNELVGEKVDINDDGDIVALGRHRNGYDQSAVKGTAKAYKWDGSSWNQLGSDIEGDALSDYFGESIALNSDGTIMAVGAWGNDDNGSASGQAKVFKWDGSSWNQLGSDIKGETTNDHLGQKISLNHNGDRLAVSAIQSDGSGYVKIYDYVDGDWNQIHKIEGESSGDDFGRGLDLSASGNRVAIGAPENDGVGSNAGETEVYDIKPVNYLKFQVGDGVQDTLTYNGVAITDSSSIVVDFDSNYDTNDSNITQLQELIEGMINQVSNTGSFLERLDHKEDIMRTRVQGLEQIRSTYEDADFAKEQMELMKVQILQQTATAALAQANSAPQSVLSLFR